MGRRHRSARDTITNRWTRPGPRRWLLPAGAGVLAIALSTVGGASPVAASRAAEPEPGGHIVAPTPVTARSATEPEPGGQIVGGETADWDDHPYFVVVGQCGGTLIATDLVLTAAHCVGGDGPLAVGLLGGDTTSTGVTVHPLWNGDVGAGHDLALVGIPSSATAGATVIQVGAPSRPDIYRAGRFGAVVGTGQTDDDEPSSQGTLRAVTGRIRSDDDMADIYDPWYLELFSNYRSSLMIGVGSRSKTTCFGDSGAPLVSHIGPSPRTLIGVSSFGWPWCSRPGVFGELDNANLAWLATEGTSIRDRWACGQGDDEGRMRVSYELLGDGPNRDYRGFLIYYSWELRCAYPTWEPEPWPEVPSGDGGSGRDICVSPKWWLCDDDLR